jgi:hypothetical protein
MTSKPPEPSDLVMTQAELPPGTHPPGVTLPDPPGSRPGPAAGDIDPQILDELRRLADRVGGIERLHEIVGVLVRFRD